MNYEYLTDDNKINEVVVPDGYKGGFAKLSIHLINGVKWAKTETGLVFRYNR